MKIKKRKRKFKVGSNITIKHVANIELNTNELITLKNKSSEYDITKKSWGYYATPSINMRLRNNGFLTAIIKNKSTKNKFIVLVDKKKKILFKNYINKENIKVIKWLKN